MEARTVVTVRTARPEDMGQMVGLLRLLFTIEEDFSFDAVRQRQGLDLLVHDKRACVLVAASPPPAEQVIGMCTGQLVISTAEGGLSLLVEDVVVLPEHRGQGVGRALIRGLTTWAKARGVTRMQLLADRNNQPALAFYDRLGWQSTALICRRCPL
jgi:ribosomal protein S18 acetylase RimI-like enzyme